MPDLINLDLSRFDMRLDLLNFRSLWELLQLVENDSEIGAWHLLYRLVAHHVVLVLQITTRVVRGIGIPVNSAGGFFISATLTIDVLRQASIALFGGFAIHGDAVVADMKDFTPES